MFNYIIFTIMLLKKQKGQKINMLTVRELEILNILWEKKQDMLVKEIVKEHPNISQSTVAAVVKKLYKEGLLEVGEIKHSGKVLGRTYRPTEAAKKKIIDDFLYINNIVGSIMSKQERCELITKK